MEKSSTVCDYPNCDLYGYGRDLMNNGKPYSCPRLYSPPGECEYVLRVLGKEKVDKD